MIRSFLAFLLVVSVLSPTCAVAQCSSPVIAGASTSGNFRGLNPNFGRGCAVYLLTAAEMAAAGFSAGSDLTGIGGTFSTAPSVSAAGALAVYLENTADVVNNKSTTWATALSGMTSVYSGSFTVPAATTWDAAFSTPFSYTGGSVYVAIEWINCGTLSTASVVQCNTALAAGVKSAQSAACAAITTLGGNSSFRPTTRFASSATNLTLVNIWPHGKIPAGAGAKEVIPFTVRNTFATAQSVTAQLVIKDAISGTIRYTESKAITIPGCAEGSGTFDHWIPQIQETDSVMITIPLQPGETVASDNTTGTTEIVGSQNYSHAKNAFGGSFSGVGFNTGSGLILSRYSGNGCVTVSNVKVRLDPSAVGNTVYGVVVSPAGLILGQSPNYVVQAADANTVVNFTLTAPVAVSAGDFYVGLAQTANAVTGYFPVSCQGENPTKPNAFYTTGLVGGALSAPYTNLNRWFIEADIAATPNVYANIATQPLYFCAGSSFPVEYTVLNGTLNPGNVFTVELSDGAGSFAVPTVIGTLSSTASIGTITATLPLGTPASSAYRIRVNASNNAITGCTGNTQLNIFGIPVFSTITATGASCNGAADGTVLVSSPAVLPVYAINPAGIQNTPGSFSGLSANTYTITVSDGNGCSATTTVAVSQPAPLTPAISVTPLCTNSSGTLTDATTGGTAPYSVQWIFNAAVIGTGSSQVITQAGTYSMTVTDANGCTASASQAVTVQTSPSVGAAVSPLAVCAGSPATLSAVGAQTYAWAPGALSGANVSVTPSASSTYTVTGVDANGCTGSSTVALLVNVAPDPVVNTDSVCYPGGAVALSASGTLIQWYDQPVGGNLLSTGSVFSPTITGTTTYYVSNSTTVTSPPTAAVLPPHFSVFNGFTRGYSLTAPVNFTITSLQVPQEAGAANQSVAVLRMNANALAPVLPATTNAFTTLFLSQNNPLAGAIPVNIPVQAGEVIVFLGAKGVTNSYANPLQPQNAVIDGITVPLVRTGFQNVLGSSAPQNIWTESTGSVSRVLFTYTTNLPVCTSTPRIAVTAVVHPGLSISGSSNPSPAVVCAGQSLALTGSGGTNYTWSDGNSTPTDGVPFAPSASSVYTVTSVDAFGCTHTSTLGVTVHATPPVSGVSSPSPAVVCAGGSVTLQGSGALAYSWTDGSLNPNNNTPFVPTTASVFTVTGVDANGCSATATLSVTANPLPQVGVGLTPTSVCLGSAVTMSGSGAATYTWTDGTNSPADGVSFVPNQLGTSTYTVTGVDANGCSQTSTLQFTVNPVGTFTSPSVLSTSCTGATGVSMLFGSVGTSGLVTYSIAPSYPVQPSAGLFTGLVGASAYTVSLSDANGCSTATAITAPALPASGELANTSTLNSFSVPGSTCQSQIQSDGTQLDYFGASCNALIASITDPLGGSALGNVSACVTVLPTVQPYNGQPYIRRWYEFTVQNQGNALVKFYFTHEDLQSYNAAAGNYPIINNLASFPIAGDTVQFMCSQVPQGVLPGAPGANTTLHTVTATWNANKSRWEVPVAVSGFSGFYFHTGSLPLPVALSSFDGWTEDGGNKLQWVTAAEKNNDKFRLQHSRDGISFQTITEVKSLATAGNSAEPLVYGYYHAKPDYGHNYYRLQQFDLDGRMSIEGRVIDLFRTADGSVVSLRPNPARDVLFVEFFKPANEVVTIKIMDMSGRVVQAATEKTVTGSNTLMVRLNDLVPGLYSVQVFEKGKLTHTGRVEITR